MSSVPAPKGALLLRFAFFAFVAIVGQQIFGLAFSFTGAYLVVAVMATFAAASVANALAIRIWERARLSDFGLGWCPASRKNLLIGVALGFGAACAVLVPPILTGFASFEPAAEVPEHRWASVLFVTVILMFGAVGEEMLFHGYGFQVLLRAFGVFATILPMGVLFGVAHLGNQNVTWVGFTNTVGWGILLGWAFVRSGALWLPIGLHFGWNWALPLFGVNLSGFTMGVSGYALRWKTSAIWSGGDYGPEGSILTLAVLAGLTLAISRLPIEREATPGN